MPLHFLAGYLDNKFFIPSINTCCVCVRQGNRIMMDPVVNIWPSAMFLCLSGFSHQKIEIPQQKNLKIEKIKNKK